MGRLGSVKIIRILEICLTACLAANFKNSSFQNRCELAPPQPLFTFVHPNLDPVIDNSRYEVGTGVSGLLKLESDQQKCYLLYHGTWHFPRNFYFFLTKSF